MKKSLFILAALAMLAASCSKPTPEAPKEPEAPVKPEVIEVYLEANPEGTDDLKTKIVAESTWTIAPYEEYDWITVSPSSGEGTTTITFTATANTSDKEKEAEFIVKENFGEGYDYKTYTIIVTQAKPESNVAPNDLAFLKAIVDGKMLGESTPTVDNWFNVDEGFSGIGLEDKDGKLYVTAIDGSPLTDFPETMILSELTTIKLRGNTTLAGKRLPKTWSTPKLSWVELAGCSMTGPIPEGFGLTPQLFVVFMDGNNFYGALPHIWESKVLECFILANVNNRFSSPASPVDLSAPEFIENQSSGLGYMVPATLDVILNKWDANDPTKHANPSRDLTQMKLGGVRSKNYIGFEKGWGQVRYEKFDAAAVKGDLTTWSVHRLLFDEQAYYFSNMGYFDIIRQPDANDYRTYAADIPQVLLDWDQTAADAFTAAKEAEYSSK